VTEKRIGHCCSLPSSGGGGPKNRKNVVIDLGPEIDDSHALPIGELLQQMTHHRQLRGRNKIDHAEPPWRTTGSEARIPLEKA
jgi:hypothetical protein